MPFLMIRNDITRVHADAIVNPANSELLRGSGTSAAIYQAAGRAELDKACRKIGHCDEGSAVITEAFNLPADYIIHAVGPAWTGSEKKDTEILYRTYISALELADENRAESVAFPLLSSGNYGFPKETALKTAVHAISDFLMEHEMLVYLVIFDKESFQVSRKLSQSVEEYIDDHYADEQEEEEEYCFEARSVRMASALDNEYSLSLDDIMEQEKEEETFSQMLLRLIDERGLKDSTVYKKANIDRRHFSKIRNDINYAPNKKTVFSFAIALELSLDETEELLMKAGYAISNCSKSDLVISYFIENRKYNIFEINEVLFSYGQAVLGG